VVPLIPVVSPLLPEPPELPPELLLSLLHAAADAVSASAQTTAAKAFHPRAPLIVSPLLVARRSAEVHTTCRNYHWLINLLNNCCDASHPHAGALGFTDSPDGRGTDTRKSQ